MGIRKSISMMSTTGTQLDLIGDKYPGNAFYGYTDAISTVQIIYQNFVGGWGLQATLALNPEPTDWFWVNLNPNGDANTPFVIYPQNQLAPTGNNGGDTGSQAFTFVGNFVWLRAVLTRSYIQPPPGNMYSWDSWQYGQLDEVLLSI
jgi:hypothetical protein